MLLKTICMTAVSTQSHDENLYHPLGLQLGQVVNGKVLHLGLPFQTMVPPSMAVRCNLVSKLLKSMLLMGWIAPHVM